MGDILTSALCRYYVLSQKGFQFKRLIQFLFSFFNSGLVYIKPICYKNTALVKNNKQEARKKRDL